MTLSCVAQMQEPGVPITYAYISDAHDGHGVAGNIHHAYGPGEAGLHTAVAATTTTRSGRSSTASQRTASRKKNTLFVVTVDEGDHFVGAAPTPTGCDGVTTPCTYQHVGEINGDLRRMIRTQFGDTTNFAVHSDDAPNVYINGNPARTDSRSRGRSSVR